MSAGQEREESDLKGSWCDIFRWDCARSVVLVGGDGEGEVVVEYGVQMRGPLHRFVSQELVLFASCRLDPEQRSGRGREPGAHSTRHPGTGNRSLASANGSRRQICVSIFTKLPPTVNASVAETISGAV